MLADRVLALERQAEDLRARLETLEALGFRLRLLAAETSQAVPVPRDTLANNPAICCPSEGGTLLPVMADGTHLVVVNDRRMSLNQFMAEVDAEYRARDDAIAERDQRIADLEARLRSADAYADSITALASGMTARVAAITGQAAAAIGSAP